MAARARFGDVLEFDLPSGFGYAQYTHKHKTYGDVVRVFSGVRKKLSSFNDLIEEEPLFITLFPVQHAVNTKVARIVAHLPIPARARAFPFFRSAGFHDPSKEPVPFWDIWDDKKWFRVTKLTEEQKRLPLGEGINDVELKQRILSGWRSENDKTFIFE